MPKHKVQNGGRHNILAKRERERERKREKEIKRDRKRQKERKRERSKEKKGAQVPESSLCNKINLFYSNC